MAKAKKAYIITRGNCWAGAVGDTVELTDEQARRLVNKVRPADEPAPATGRGGQAAKRVKELEARVKELEAAADPGAAERLAELERTVAEQSQHLADARDGVALYDATMQYLDKAAESDEQLAAYLAAARATVTAG